MPPAGAPVVRPVVPAVAGPGEPSAALDEAAIARDLLAAIQQQVELAIDIRLREALTPILARATDTVVREARRDLTATLHDLVQRAVQAELARRKRG